MIRGGGPLYLFRSRKHPVGLGPDGGHRAKKRPLRRHGLWPSRQRDPVGKLSRRTGPRRRAQSEKASTAPTRLMVVAPTRPGREAIPLNWASAAGTERKSVRYADMAYGRRANATG